MFIVLFINNVVFVHIFRDFRSSRAQLINNNDSNWARPIRGSGDIAYRRTTHTRRVADVQAKCIVNMLQMCTRYVCIKTGAALNWFPVKRDVARRRTLTHTRDECARLARSHVMPLRTFLERRGYRWHSNSKRGRIRFQELYREVESTRLLKTAPPPEVP